MFRCLHRAVLSQQGHQGRDWRSLEVALCAGMSPPACCDLETSTTSTALASLHPASTTSTTASLDRTGGEKQRLGQERIQGRLQAEISSHQSREAGQEGEVTEQTAEIKVRVQDSEQKRQIQEQEVPVQNMEQK